jgi:phosphohistidine swiveling domain-containing protein
MLNTCGVGEKVNICNTMNQERKNQLQNAQHKDKILAIGEFDFPFSKYDLLHKEGVIILRLQGFNVVSIIGLNLDIARVGDFALLITHSGMYIRVQV